jgi:hypothetical protein
MGVCKTRLLVLVWNDLIQTYLQVMEHNSINVIWRMIYMATKIWNIFSTITFQYMIKFPL